MDHIVTPATPCEGPAVPSHKPPEGGCSVRLSEKDAAEVMATAESPPAPNEAALQAARRFIQCHG